MGRGKKKPKAELIVGSDVDNSDADSFEGFGSVARVPDAPSAAAPANNAAKKVDDAGAGGKTAAQKKRTQDKAKKKAAAEARQIRAEHEAAGDPGLLKEAEQTAVATVLASLQLAVVPVPADGDCLFTALAHQLGTVAHPRASAVSTASAMRQALGAAIAAAWDDYAPFAIDDDGNGLTAEAYRANLEGTMWGGDLELKAASELFHVGIRVVTADGPHVVEPPEGAEGAALLTVAFYRHRYALGAHYEATTPLA